MGVFHQYKFNKIINNENKKITDLLFQYGCGCGLVGGTVMTGAITPNVVYM
jgi:hypothetical protein